MPYKSISGNDAVARYVNETIVRETPIQQRLRAQTARMANGGMQISPDQGAFLSLLVKLNGTHRAIEIGTFTGYSALCIASALPADGRLICCDVSAEWTAIGRRHWQEANLDRRIDLRIGPATGTLDQLLKEGQAGSFDFAFIDADKEAYDAYYESALTLLRPGGLVVLDNVLRAGKVADANQDPATKVIHHLNLKIRDDQRVDAALATIGDGLMLARKR